jgi:alpha-galactosidase
VNQARLTVERPPNCEVQFYKRAAVDAARYVSDTTVREEVLHHGRLITLYWSAIGEVLREVGPGRGPQELALDPAIFPVEAFELEIDGQLLHNCWSWVDAYERPGARPGTVEAVIVLRHELRPVTVEVVTRLDGTPILTRWLEITNTGPAAAALSRVSPCSGLLWHTQAGWEVAPGKKPAYHLGYDLAQQWGQEGDFAWIALPGENLRIERTRDKNYGAPSFILRNEITGELFFLALAWSGNWAAEFAPTPDGMLSFRLGPIGPAPIRVITPGETLHTPEVHIGPLHRNDDAAVQAWHRHMYASVLPPRPVGKEMYNLGAHVVEFPGEWILREIDIAKEMGVQAFMVDAGWYGDVFGGWTERRGDWWEGAWLPGGLAGIREHAHRQGLLFGLWMEPEAAGPLSKVAQEHPDWLLQTDDGRWPGGVRVLNLGLPEVARFFEDEIVRVIRDHQLDFFKIDYNVRVHEGGQNQRDGFLENEGWRHMEVLYGVFDRVRREFPDVALENCAGGGGRLDLGMMSRFHYSCESDFSHFPLSIRAISGLTYFAPPKALCYYHNHMYHAHETADLDTHLRVTLFATAIFVGFGAQNADRSTPYFLKTKRYIELAKDFCYPLIAAEPLVYHHTPGIGVLRPAPWCVLEYAAPDHSRGYCGVFALSRDEAAGDCAEYRLRLRGVDRSRTYEVTLDNSGETVRVSGHELANTGLTIPLAGNMISELVLYTAVS